VIGGQVLGETIGWQSWLNRIARNKMLLLMVGGALGTCLRYYLSRWISSHPWAGAFPPLGTMVVNVTGSFILGVAFVMLFEKLPPEYQGWYLLIGAGFCGGYTTFSTFELETFMLIRDGSWWLALANIVGSVVAGFVGVVLAVVLVNGLFPER
jgi:CrcB protein